MTEEQKQQNINALNAQTMRSAITLMAREIAESNERLYSKLTDILQEHYNHTREISLSGYEKKQ